MHRPLVEIHEEVLLDVPAVEGRQVGREGAEVRLQDRNGRAAWAGGVCARSVSAGQHAQCRLVEILVCCGNDAAARSSVVLHAQLVAAPIGDIASCTRDHGNQSHVVVDPEVRLHDEVGAEARCDEGVRVAVRAVEGPLHLLAHRGEAVSLEAGLEHVGRGRVHHGVGERRGTLGPHGLAVQRGTMAHDTDPTLVEDTLVNDANERTTLVAQPDESSEKRLPGDERLRAVDGVEHPAEVGVGADAPQLFAEDAMFRVFRLDHLAHRRFRVPVRDCHRAHRVRALSLDLLFHRDGAPPKRQDFLPRYVREPLREAYQLIL
mmetsp:Transcript_32083/g.88644  ORF Transcript_32083/g.88644 Transcript_32083/m.88644 type:complete len:319 (-) Transcript_32083:113-1069(-)